MPFLSKITHEQRGIAMVELTIVLPLLLLLLLAVAELGRGLYDYNTLTKAMRDGARYLAAVAFNGSARQVDITRNDPDLATSGVQISIEAVAKNLVVCGKSVCGGTPPLLPNLKIENINVDASQAPSHITISTDPAKPYNFQLLTGNPLNALLGLFGGSIANGIPLNASVTMRPL